MKLIRDKIPIIALAKGETMSVRIASDNEYEILLRRKLMEELSEYLESEEPEELADIFEVLRAIANSRGISHQRLYGRRKSAWSMETVHHKEPLSKNQLHERLYLAAIRYVETEAADHLLDVVGCLRAIMLHRSLSAYFLFALRDKKRSKRGGFEGRVVWDNEEDVRQ